jgi:transcriptional regulator with XRE-family HTH domain
MKEFKVKKISKELNISHSAVSQWFSGCTMPKYNYMVYLYKNYHIPFLAWQDIQSYINESITANTGSMEIENNCKSMKEKI